MLIASVLLIWTLASCYFILINLGNKYPKRSKYPKLKKAFEWAFYAPAFAIAAVVGLIGGAYGQYLLYQDQKRTPKDL